MFNELDELDEELEGSLQISSVQKIHLAARRGDLETVTFLVDREHQNPLQKDQYGNTALHAAAQGGSLDVLKYFINERDCNPACLGYLGGTPLHVANEHDVIKYLVIEQQVEPLCQDEGRVTLLHLSSERSFLNIGHLGNVKFLTLVHETLQFKEIFLQFKLKRYLEEHFFPFCQSS